MKSLCKNIANCSNNRIMSFLLLLLIAIIFVVGVCSIQTVFATDTDVKIVEVGGGACKNTTLVAKTSDNDDKWQYVWQYDASTEEHPDNWVDIKDENKSTLKVTSAMVKSIVDENGEVTIRSMVTDSNGSFVDSELFTIKLLNDDSYDLPSESYNQNLQIDNSVNNSLSSAGFLQSLQGALDGTHKITINFLDNNTGDKLAESLEATWDDTSMVSWTVDIKASLGFRISATSSNEKIEAAFSDHDTKLTLKSLCTMGEVGEDVIVDVKFDPKQCGYTILRYCQKADSDDYELVQTIDQLYAPYSSVVPTQDELSYQFVGFTLASYDSEMLTSNSSTAIKIYYDRNYYKVAFDWNGGVDGPVTVFGKYGSKTGLSAAEKDPTKVRSEFVKAGYDWVTWCTDSSLNTPVSYDSAITSSGMPLQIPIPSNGNDSVSYYAKWQIHAKAPVTVNLWIQHADDDDYSLDGTKVKEDLDVGTEYSLCCGLPNHNHIEAECGIKDTCPSKAHKFHTSSCLMPHSYGQCADLPPYVRTCIEENGIPNGGYGYTFRVRKGFSKIIFTSSEAYAVVSGNESSLGTVHFHHDNWYEDEANDIEGDPIIEQKGSYYYEVTAMKSVYSTSCPAESHTHTDDCYACGLKNHQHNYDYYSECVHNIRSLFDWDPRFLVFDHSDSVIVEPDGSSVNNIYLNPKVHKCYFLSEDYKEMCEPITAKLGADIFDEYKQRCLSITGGARDCLHWYSPNSGDDPSIVITVVRQMNPGKGVDSQNCEDICYVCIEDDTYKGSIKRWVQKLDCDGDDFSYYDSSGTKRTANTTTYVNATDMECYSLDHSYKTVTGHLHNEEKIPGFIKPTAGTKYCPSQEESIINANVFYLRDKFDFNFWVNDKLNTTVKIFYEKPFDQVTFVDSAGKTVKLTEYVPERPEGVSSHYVFGGWYYDATFTKQCNFLDSEGNPLIMPCEAVNVYCKWVPEIYKVNFYTNESCEELADSNIQDLNITYNEKIDNIPAVPASPDASSKFIGWCYKTIDSEGKEIEKAFDPNSMVVSEPMNLYPKYKTTKSRNYNIKYVCINSETNDDQAEEVANEKSGQGVIGTTIELVPKTGNELDLAYRSGYMPTSLYETQTISEYEEDNEFLVEYVKGTANYRVRYLCDEAPIADEKYVTDSELSTVTEWPKSINGYICNNTGELSLDLVMEYGVPVSKSSNIITFEYTKAPENTKTYQINYIKMNNDTTGVTEESVNSFTTDSTITVPLNNYTGYDYLKSELNGAAIADITQPLTLSSDEANIINVYYDPQTINYQITASYLKDDGSWETIWDTKSGSAKCGTTFDYRIYSSSVGYEDYSPYINNDSFTLAPVYDAGKDYMSYNFKFVMKTAQLQYRTELEDGRDVKGGDIHVNDASGAVIFKETIGVSTGTASTVYANCFVGFEFKCWKSNGTVVSENQTFTPTKEATQPWQDTVYTAVFAEKQATINYSSNDAYGGTVSVSSQTIGAATGSPHCVATPKENYKFIMWATLDKSGAEPVYKQISTDADFTPKKDSITGQYISESYCAVFAYQGNLTFNITGYNIVYDGVEHTPTWSCTPSNLHYNINIDLGPTKKDAFDTAESITYSNLSIKDNKDVDIKSMLTVGYSGDTQVKIDKRPYTVKTASASKKDDGSALTAPDAEIYNLVNMSDITSVKGVGKLEGIGQCDNTPEVIWSSETMKNNYLYDSANSNIGKLTIFSTTANAVIVTTSDISVPYDGKEHSLKDLSPTVNIEKSNSSWSVTYDKKDIKLTHVSSKPESVELENIKVLDSTGTEVTGVDVYTSWGNFSISKAALQVKTDSAGRVYNGKELKGTGSLTGLAKPDGAEETVEFAVTGSITNVGSVTNSYYLLWNGTARESDYNITEDIGTLTITEYAGKIVITVQEYSPTYNGSSFLPSVSYKADGVTSPNTMPEGYNISTLDVERETNPEKGGVVHVSEGKVDFTCKAVTCTNADGNAVSLTIEYKKGYVEVKPQELIITTDGATKQYNGEPLTATGTISGFATNSDRENATFSVTGSQIIPGESENSYSLNFKSPAQETDYSKSEKLGNLKVTNNTSPVEASIEKLNVPYDGKEHTPKGSLTGLPNVTGFTYTVSTTTKSTNACDTTAACDTVQILKDGNDVTSYFDNISRKDGSLTITKLHLSVTTGSANKTYDGTALTNDVITISGWLSGESAPYSATGSQKTVGSSKNTYSIDWDNTSATAKVGNYIIDSSDEILGDLTVTHYAGNILITTKSNAPDGKTSVVYDGKTYGGAVTYPTLPTGYHFDNDKSGCSVKVKDVTTSTVSLTCDNLVILDVDNNVVYERDKLETNLNVAYADSTLNISKRPLIVKTYSDSKTFDGTELTASGTCEGWANGESAEFITTGSQTDVGLSKNTYAIKWKESTTAKESNYSVSETLGTLTVSVPTTAVTVTVIPKDESVTYDAKPHGAKEVTVEGLDSSIYDWDAQCTETITDVNLTHEEGELDCDVLHIYTKIGGVRKTEITDKLSVTKIPGFTNIGPAELIIYTQSAIKAYDGSPLTKTDGVSVDGLVNGEKAKVSVTGSRTEVGRSKNTAEIDWSSTETTAKQRNYKVVDNADNTNLGYLTVVPSGSSILVSSTDEIFTYNGTERKANIVVDNLPGGYTYKFSDEALNRWKLTNVGSVDVDVSRSNFKIFDDFGIEVTDTFDIVFQTGSIKVDPKTLRVYHQGVSKPYDGTPINGSANYEVADLVDVSDVVSITDSSTIKEVGRVENKYIITFKDEQTEKNYSISDGGTTYLEITHYAGLISVSTTADSSTYDGKPHGATVQVTGLPDDDYYKVHMATSSAISTDATPTPITATCDNLVITFGLSEATAPLDKLNIAYNNDLLSISKKLVKVYVSGGSWLYDGTPHTVECTIDEDAGFVQGESATLVTLGSQTEVGKSKNSYRVDWDSTNTPAKEINYDVQSRTDDKDGWLEVTEYTGEISVKTVGENCTYDGLEHGATVSVTGLPEGLYTCEKASCSTKLINAGESDAKCDTLLIRNKTGYVVYDSNSPEQSKMNVKFYDGNIAIGKATLTVKTNSNQKEYDGSPLTGEGSIEGFQHGEQATFEVTGSQTEVGQSDNSYKLVFNKTALTDNYKVTEDIGKLKVIETTQKITINSVTEQFTYDSLNHSAKVEVSDLPQGYYWKEGNGPNTSNVVLHVDDGIITALINDSYCIVNESGKDVTQTLKDNGNIVITEGYISVVPTKLHVSTSSEEKVYTGYPVTNSKYSVTGWVGNEFATVSTTGSQTEVGSSLNTYEIKWDKGADPNDYDIVENLGSLKVTEYSDEIIFKITDYQAEYDGMMHIADVIEPKLPSGYFIEEVSVEPVIVTHVTDAPIQVPFKKVTIINRQRVDVTDRLNITKIPGSITLTPKELQVTTSTETKLYDGKPLTGSGEVQGFIDGEEASFKVTGSQTEVGSSENTYTLDFDKNAQKTDYSVSESLGKLTVTSNTPVPVNPDDVSNNTEISHSGGATSDFNVLVIASLIGICAISVVVLLISRRKKC